MDKLTQSKLDIARAYMSGAGQQEMDEVLAQLNGGSYCPECKKISVSFGVIPPGDPAIRNLNRVIVAIEAPRACPQCGHQLWKKVPSSNTEKKIHLLMASPTKDKGAKSPQKKAKAPASTRGPGGPSKWVPAEIVADQEYSCGEAEKLSGPNQPIQQQRLKEARDKGELAWHQGPRNKIMVWGRDLKAWLHKQQRME